MALTDDRSALRADASHMLRIYGAYAPHEKWRCDKRSISAEDVEKWKWIIKAVSDGLRCYDSRGSYAYAYGCAIFKHGQNDL